VVDATGKKPKEKKVNFALPGMDGPASGQEKDK